MRFKSDVTQRCLQAMSVIKKITSPLPFKVYLFCQVKIEEVECCTVPQMIPNRK